MNPVWLPLEKFSPRILAADEALTRAISWARQEADAGTAGGVELHNALAQPEFAAFKSQWAAFKSVATKAAINLGTLAVYDENIKRSADGLILYNVMPIPRHAPELSQAIHSVVTLMNEIVQDYVPKNPPRPEAAKTGDAHEPYQTRADRRRAVLYRTADPQ